MADKVEKKDTSGNKSAEVLGKTYEAGKSEGEDMGKWRQKLPSREEKLKYLKTGERYWFNEEWYGSEKRKNPA